MNGRSNSRSEESGAAAVELALILLPIVMIFAAIVDFGFIFNAQLGLTHAAREGVRQEVISAGTGAATAEDRFVAVSVSGISATVSPDCASGDEARVVIGGTYTYLMLSIIPGFEEVDLSGEAVMRCGG
jgi:hypothetical protein